ncbi:FAD-dependent pyridine nucleotide-disulphide oxidoreductase [Anaeromyxobacter sp. K]|uniref:NAD(P)/FAD-dependent oxidoreductase n=1 Tax=Anaeromyxobacter sp. (strain K) TaxID=447217 RepID=UPI00015F8B88|nr:FAD-dependent oxidoreductase [Anaeromyxobacter sp. K]ACG75248.1 FAD-dependent pyridine nucleotide-disulphide oxidoreductase [Anaeromyxobacter sp. K]
MGKRALVLGGGFAGLESAVRLRARGFEVTLVSDRPYLFIHPTSIWIPTGELAFDDACLDLAGVAARRGFELRVGKVEEIEGASRRAKVDGRRLAADHLVVALGASRLRPEGVEHTVTLGGDPAAATSFRMALEALLARGRGRIAVGFGGNPKAPSAVRGGPAFEVAFNLDALLRRRGLRDRFELTFFAPMARPGERMGAKAVEAVGRMLARQGIAARAGRKILSFDTGGVALEGAERIDADLVAFLPAGDGHPLARGSDLPLDEAGFVRVDSGCAVPGMPGVWAVGDVAALEGPAWSAKQGHLAQAMARVAADNAASCEAGGAPCASYLGHLAIVCLMDTGTGGALVYRDDRTERLVPLPVVGHWMKKAWGRYFKAERRGVVPRVLGM